MTVSLSVNNCRSILSLLFKIWRITSQCFRITDLSNEGKNGDLPIHQEQDKAITSIINWLSCPVILQKIGAKIFFNSLYCKFFGDLQLFMT